MTTSGSRDKTGFGPAVQRTAVFSAAVLLLVMGTGLAFAAGAADSSVGSTPAVIESDRPVQRVPSANVSATAGIAAAGGARPTDPESDSDRDSEPTAASPSSSAGRKPRQTGSTAKKRRESDKRETVAPPVRDDDDDDDADEDDEDDHETVAPPVRDDDEGHESD